MNAFLAELRRRYVFRVAAGYLVVAWLLVQVAGAFEDGLGLPGWFDTAVIGFLALGFPVALVLAWAFELTPEGTIRLTPPPGPGESAPPAPLARTDLALIVALGAVLAVSLYLVVRPPAAAPRAARAGELSLAVLPFVNMSSDPEQEYFSDGLSEELLNQVAQLEALRVIARTSSFAFKGQSPDARAVGATLGATHLLEGSVRKSGDQLRITAQLIDASDGAHLWSKTYDRRVDDVFAVQDEIALAVADQLSDTFGLRASMADFGGSSSFEAYDSYLRARALFGRAGAADLEAAIVEYRRAVALDPDYGLAWAGLADAAQLLSVVEPTRAGELQAVQEDALRRALQAAPDSWQVRAQLGELLWTRKDWIGAADAWAAAEARVPATDPEWGAAFAGAFLAQVGRIAEARAGYAASREADPLSRAVLSGESWMHDLAGEPALAAAEYARVEALGGGNALGQFRQLLRLLRLGDAAAVETFLAGRPDDRPAQAQFLARFAEVWDEPEAALALLRTLESDPAFAGPNTLPPYAVLAAHYGDDDLALELLRRDYLERGGYLTAYLWMPQFASMRATDEFETFVAELGLLDYWRETGAWSDFCRPVGDGFACE